MAKVIVNPTSASRREIDVPRSILYIGRDPSNDVVLPDAMVSRRHAVVEYRGSRYYLRDCNSSNGSLVNGDRISERRLRDGDTLAIGSARMLFRDDVVSEDAAGKVIRHPSAPVLNCPDCEAEHRSGDAFCRQCGARLGAQEIQPRTICAGCGSVVQAPASFCNACGTTLGSDQVTQPQDVPAEDSLIETHQDSDADTPPPPSAPQRLVADALPAPEEEPEEYVATEEIPEDLAPPRPEPPAPPPALEPAASPPKAEPARPRAVPPRSAPPRSVAPMRSARSAPAAAAARAMAPARSPRPFPSRPDSTARRLPGPAADLDKRLLGGLLDLLGVLFGGMLLLTPVALYWWLREIPASGQPMVALLLSLAVMGTVGLLGAGYFVYFWGVRGATPGKRLAGVAVEAEDGTCPVGVARATARLLGYLLSAALLGVGFFMILYDGRGLHDRLAGTRVVRRDD